MELLKRKIKALSLNRLDQGSIGFITAEDEGKWYNVTGEKEVLEEMMKNVVSKGNIIEFEFNNGIVGTITLIEKGQEGGFDDMTTFKDLLEDAHKKFPKMLEIETCLIENDWEKKRAIFKAKVKADGNVYEAYGDADQDNCGTLVQKHWVRMAETRAIARALRWATNNAGATVEETESDQVKPKEQ